MLSRNLRVATTAALALTVLAASSVAPRPAPAVPLGDADPIPIPSPNPAEPPNQPYALVTDPGSGELVGGSWVSPALPDWVGTFTASGPVPASTINPAGTTDFDFSTMPTGHLPTGTYFAIGDLDSAGNEMILLQAFDAVGSAITSRWLEEPAFVRTPVSATDMPEASFDLLTGIYTLDGTGVPGNPSILFFMESNVDIAALEVTRTSEFASLSLRAPVPEPGSAVLLGGGLAALALRRPDVRARRGSAQP